MIRVLKFVVLLILLAAVSVQADKMLVDFEGAFDLKSVKKSNAQVAIARGAKGQSLSVLMQKNVPASIQLSSKKEWNLSECMALAVDITNTGKKGIGILANVIGGGKANDGFVWVEPGKTDTLIVLFYRKDPPEYMNKYFENMRALPGGHAIHWRVPDYERIKTVIIYNIPSDEDVRFRVDNIRGTGSYDLPSENKLKSGFFPFVDKYGQYKHKDWPGKVKSDSDIRAQHQREVRDLAKYRGPKTWSKYGGWKNGPKLRVTGHFRTEKIKDKWWLVDPEGRLFWSTGITGVHSHLKTDPRGRENYFTAIKENGDFRMANLKIKYGGSWESKDAEQAHKRFRSWGINTMACWSSSSIYDLRKTPYTVFLMSGIPKEMPEHLDENSFRQTVMRRINPQKVASFKDDPWCLGVFVDNELHWPEKNKAAVVETYFKVVGEVMKRVAPKKLYLGSRIHKGGADVYVSASKYCDVVSINRYTFSIYHEDLKKPCLDKPMIIGEFHFGALDRGLLHTGLMGVGNQKTRADAYTFYINQALNNKRLVGAHWFQFSDQMVTGRKDGEAFQIGFVDILDKPYEEMIDASRKLSDSIYNIRYRK